ncbi:hypothetical protein FAUST_3091 [Fusarium austroamericanum]|uniref:Uncharacterized protein n=1 Tax=Fusarium austroamericanum TaxID=282268 RepID=A0AAN6C5G9_FUSAU|nr:hypothetical protein FAUST_3091 [Fusarium austroamericanum]
MRASAPSQGSELRLWGPACARCPACVQDGRDEESNDSSTVRGHSESSDAWIDIPEGDEDLYGDGQDVSPPLAHAAPAHEAPAGANDHQPSMPTIQGMFQGDTMWQQGLRGHLEDLVSKLSSHTEIEYTTGPMGDFETVSYNDREETISASDKCDDSDSATYKSLKGVGLA